MSKNLTERKMSSEKEETSDREISSDIWTSEEKNSVKSLYGCEIIKQNCTDQEAKTKDAPSDAYIVIYRVNGKDYIDLCRGTRVRIFELYYDKFGSGSLQSIDWGCGKINPKLWGYEAPKVKKRK